MAHNLKDDVIYNQPKTLEEREEMAQVCALHLPMDIPMLLDDIDNHIDTLYAALPERLYLLDAEGIVRFRTVVGSPGFDVPAWEEAIARLVASLS